jgi:hypothetical protein
MIDYKPVPEWYRQECYIWLDSYCGSEDQRQAFFRTYTNLTATFAGRIILGRQSDLRPCDVAEKFYKEWLGGKTTPEATPEATPRARARTKWPKIG